MDVGHLFWTKIFKLHFTESIQKCLLASGLIVSNAFMFQHYSKHDNANFRMISYPLKIMDIFFRKHQNVGLEKEHIKGSLDLGLLFLAINIFR